MEINNNQIKQNKIDQNNFSERFSKKKSVWSQKRENVREILDSIFEEWQIKELVKFIVTDNVKDISKAIELSENFLHIRCMGHLLNLMVRKVIKKDYYILFLQKDMSIF